MGYDWDLAEVILFVTFLLSFTTIQGHSKHNFVLYIELLSSYMFRCCTRMMMRVYKIETYRFLTIRYVIKKLCVD